MTFVEAQADMRRAYHCGGPGVLVSGLVWGTACAIAYTMDARAAMVALWLGGMAIHPLAVLVCQLIRTGSGKTSGNKLATLAMESTVILILGVFLAYALSLHRTELFFSAMLVVIGGRYLVFQTLFGLRLYWVLGGLLAALGIMFCMDSSTSVRTLLVGAGVELGFGILLLVTALKKRNT